MGEDRQHFDLAHLAVPPPAPFALTVAQMAERDTLVIDKSDCDAPRIKA